MKKGFVFISILMSIHLFGSDLPQARFAESLYEGKQYDRSIGLYQNLLQESVVPWEKAVYMYNIGTALLKDGQTEKAIQTLSAVPFDNSLAPVLRYRVNRNLLLAYASQAQENAALDSLQNAEEQLSSLNAHYCELENRKGNLNCSGDPDYQSFAEMLRKIRDSINQSKKEEKEPNTEVAPQKTEPLPAEKTPQIGNREIQQLFQMNRDDGLPLPESVPQPKKEEKPW